MTIPTVVPMAVPVAAITAIPVRVVVINMTYLLLFSVGTDGSFDHRWLTT